jgi:hypothetical protein
MALACIRKAVPLMSREDFSVHTEECDIVGDAMPITSLPDEVNSMEDLDCECWNPYDSIEEI